jgi:hypothetical protein
MGLTAHSSPKSNEPRDAWPKTPMSAGWFRPRIYRRLVPGFPFGILYRIDAHEIVVLAVMHLRRRPGYWMDRV